MKEKIFVSDENLFEWRQRRTKTNEIQSEDVFRNETKDFVAKSKGAKVNLNFLELKAKHQPKEFTINVYQTDFDKLSKFVEFINRNKSAEETIALEDLFEELMKVTDQVEGFSEYLANNKGVKRGRKRTPTDH